KRSIRNCSLKQLKEVRFTPSSSHLIQGHDCTCRDDSSSGIRVRPWRASSASNGEGQAEIFLNVRCRSSGNSCRGHTGGGERGVNRIGCSQSGTWPFIGDPGQ